MWTIMNEYINRGVDLVVYLGNTALMPLMCVVSLAALTVRLIIYLTVKAESAFAMEFEKRVHKYLADPSYEPNLSSFHELTKRLLERTYEEHYNLRRKYRRRRFDQITSITDRIFLIVEGASRLIADTLSQTKYLRKDGQPPRFIDIAKFVFESNPVFNRVLGLFPLGMFNDILNILPGLFVVGGIFGTFLGVMGALPELSHIDINDVVKTKSIMDKFLLSMAFSMGTSIVGIVFSVALTILNAMLNPEGIYYSMVNKFTSALEFLWNDTTNNDVVDMTAYSTDRRAVSFSNKAFGERKDDKKPELEEAPALPMKGEQEPAPPAEEAAPRVPDAEVSRPIVADVSFEDLGEVLQKMDETLTTIEEGVGELETELSADAESSSASDEDRLAVLRHRLQVLDTYLRKADEDRETGLMSEEMWKDETEAYREERQSVEAQIQSLESSKKAA
jgi:hypothetical protein